MISTYNKAVNPTKLWREIQTLLSTKALSLSTVGLEVSVETEALTPTEQQDLDNLISSHTTSDSSASVSAIIESAMEFGQASIRRFAIENILLGVTQAGKTIPLSLYCHRLEHYMSTGSLYAAIAEIDTLIADTSQAKLDLDPFITNARLQAYKEEIETYLGI